MKIKEMVYTTEYVTELLGHGVYNGYEYAIVSRGTHPCAYVRLPEDHYYYGKSYDEIPVDCHGGLSYSYDFIEVMLERSGWWIGWDYAHCGDYIKNWSTSVHRKKWTYSEIFEEVKQVIKQLKEKERKNE